MSTELKILLDRYVGFVLLFVLHCIARLIGVTIGRDHSLAVKGDILVIKMLGGGSLVMALPALLGIRRAYPTIRLRLLTTVPIRPFAETLGVFDTIDTVDDRSIISLIKTGLHSLRSCMGCDTVIDLEIYSYLTTIFSLLTLARNRLGFFFDENGFHQRLHTHRVFFNPATPLYRHYDRMAALVGATIVPMPECAAHVRQTLGIKPDQPRQGIAVGCGCSDFSYQVRKLAPDQWSRHIFAAETDKSRHVVFLGAAADWNEAETIIASVHHLTSDAWSGKLTNLCGSLKLQDSLKMLASCDAFWGIDSSLLHYARLFGLSVQGFFGPADPSTRLRPITGLQEKIHYRRTLCSPCVHQISRPPCHGNNLCMKWLFEVDAPQDLRHAWIPTTVDTPFTEKERL